jgi:DNA-binding NtrC family response regulator
LVALVGRSLAVRGDQLEARAARQVRERSLAMEIVGVSPAFLEVKRVVEDVAGSEVASVLIQGESGSGKNVLARYLHARSRRRARPILEVSCAAIPDTLLESELFGHEKGAFTDAKALKRGLIEVADRGTLLLDEIGTLPLELQAKLLLFLESREIRRVGGSTPIRVRTRVIAATNDDLRRRVRERAFRQDLLYRLDVAAIEMPPLREMPGVIGELAERFVRQVAAELGRAAPQIAGPSLAALVAYPWPGNARELRNAVERALIFHAGGPLEIRPPAFVGDPDATDAASGVALPHGLTLDEVERRYLAAALEANGRDLADLAAQLGISRKTLWEKRRRYGL